MSASLTHRVDVVNSSSIGWVANRNLERMQNSSESTSNIEYSVILKANYCDDQPVSYFVGCGNIACCIDAITPSSPGSSSASPAVGRLVSSNLIRTLLFHIHM